MTALDDLRLPPGLPRRIVACVGEDENGALRSVSQGFMDLLTPHGLAGHGGHHRAVSAEGFVRGLIDLALEVWFVPAYAQQHAPGVRACHSGRSSP